MSLPEKLETEQIAKLDKAALVAIILKLQEQIEVQAKLIQELRDQIAKNSAYGLKTSSGLTRL